MPVMRCAPCPACGACTATTFRRVCGACCQPAIKSPNCWQGSPSGREPEPFPGREAVRRHHSAQAFSIAPGSDPGNLVGSADTVLVLQLHFAFPLKDHRPFSTRHVRIYLGKTPESGCMGL